jgi:hypothetical protein
MRSTTASVEGRHRPTPGQTRGDPDGTICNIVLPAEDRQRLDEIVARRPTNRFALLSHGPDTMTDCGPSAPHGTLPKRSPRPGAHICQRRLKRLCIDGRFRAARASRLDRR